MLLWCDITVGSSIVSTALSFSFNLSENPTSNFIGLIRCKMKWTKDQVLTDAVCKFIKIKVNPLFPNVGIWRKAMQRLCFSTTWHCIVSFLWRPAFFYFVFYTVCVNRWAGLNKQCLEAGVYLLRWRWCLATLLHHKVVHCTSFEFWNFL